MRIFRTILVAVFLCTVTVSASAQLLLRTFVSSTGDDLNDCSILAPCRTFNGALAKTADRGEILALDTAGYGGGGGVALTISKSVTIDGNGTRATVSANVGSEAVIVTNPGIHQIVVTLRNISVSGRGLGTNGIRFNSGKRLALENVEILGFTGRGIYIETNGEALLTLNNVQVEDSGGIGIEVSPVGAGSVVVNAKNIRVLESATSSGMYLNGNVRAVVADSEFSSCKLGAGVTTGGTANVSLDHVRAVGNRYGVLNYWGTPTVRLHNSTLIGNSDNGALNSAGTMTAYQSNVIQNPSGVTSTPPM